MNITSIHLARLMSLSGISIRITRGARSCRLKAVPAKSTAKLVGADGSYSVIEVADWLVYVCDWTLADPKEPQLGDLITVDTSTAYRVAHPDEKTPVFTNFNQLDRPAKAWRIHSIPE